MDELKMLLCAHCGGNPSMVNTVRDRYHVECISCGLRGPGKKTPEESKRSWNDLMLNAGGTLLDDFVNVFRRYRNSREVQ